MVTDPSHDETKFRETGSGTDDPSKEQDDASGIADDGQSIYRNESTHPNPDDDVQGQERDGFRAEPHSSLVARWTGELGPALSSMEETPQLDALTVKKLADILPRAEEAGVAYMPHLRKALGSAIDDRAGDVQSALEAPPRFVREQLRSLFTDCTVENLEAVRTELDKLVHEVERAERRAGITTTWDQRATVARTWWGPEDDHELAAVVRDVDPDDVESPRTGRVVLVGVSGAQVGEGNEQTNVFVHEIANPDIDFRRVLEQDAVRAALVALTRSPKDDGLRTAAVDALTSARPESSEGWTEAYASLATASTGLAATRLNGTVALVESRGVQIGDTNLQYNRIVHTLSPTIDAATLLVDTPGLAEGLLDVACAKKNSPRAESAFTAALTGTLTDTLGASPVSSAGYGTTYRPPAPGRTLRVTKAAGIMIGDDVEQENLYEHVARLGRAVITETRRGAATINQAAANRASETRGEA